MRKILLAAGTLSALVATGLLALASLASAQAGPTTWTVWAGFAATETGLPPTAPHEVLVLSNDFQPRPLEIHVGDTIEFRNGGFHTVAVGRGRLPIVQSLDPFVPNPDVFAPSGGNVFDGTNIVNSGIMEGPMTFPITFTRPGEYQVICDIHTLALPGSGMEMTVVVKPIDEPLPRTPDQGLADATLHFWNDFANRTPFGPGALAQLARASTVKVAQVPVPSGWAYEVNAGFGDGHVEGLRFLPQSLVVKAGEWIKWVNPDTDSPHTVTLLPGGGLLDHNVPPPPDLSPFAPFGGNVYTGQNIVNVPVMRNPIFQVAGVTDSGIIQFTTAGTYNYFCILHAELGMVGTIEVLPS